MRDQATIDRIYKWADKNRIKYNDLYQMDQDAGRSTQTDRMMERVNKLCEYIDSETSFKGAPPDYKEAAEHFEGKDGFTEDNIRKWVKRGLNGLYDKGGLLFYSNDTE